MGTHKRAWSGLNIVVFGGSPMAAMQVEQAISAAAPSNEVKVTSFEKYDDALDFCKSRKDVGMVFLFESCGNLHPRDVLQQLGKPYEARGWPVFGVLLHENGESLVGLRTLNSSSNLLSYISSASLLDPDQTPETLNDIWSAYSNAFQEHLVPKALEKTLLSLAAERLSQSSILFLDRASTLIYSNLDVSWLDTLAIRWAPIMDAVKSVSPTSAAANPILQQIAATAHPTQHAPNALSTAKLRIPLPQKIVAITQLLDIARNSGRLEQALLEIGTQSKPGAPALIRQMTSMRTNLLLIASDSENATLEQIA